MKVAEEAWTNQVLEACALFGWRAIHHRPARTSKGWRTAMQGDVGFPDVIAVRAGWMLALELKTDAGKATPDQLWWVGDLAMVPGVIARVLRPKDWKWLEVALRRPQLAAMLDAEDKEPSQEGLTRDWK